MSSLVVRPCLPLAGIGICAWVLAPPCQMMRIWQVRPPSSPGFPAVATISVMTARMSSLRWAWVVAWASKTAFRSAPAALIQAVSWLVRVTGWRARWAASWLSAARAAASLSSRAASRVRATSRFSGSNVVVLAQRPVCFVAGAFGGAFEHGQVLAVLGAGVGQGLDGGGQGSRGEHGQQLVQDRFVQPPSADPLAGPGAVHLVRPAAPVGGAAAGGVGDLHEPPAPPAPQQALQPGRAFPRGPARAAGGARCVGGQPGDVGVVGVQGDVAGMMAGDHHGPLVAGQPPLPGDHGAAGVQVLFGLAAPVGEDPGIAGMDQDVVHGRVRRPAPR